MVVVTAGLAGQALGQETEGCGPRERTGGRELDTEGVRACGLHTLYSGGERGPGQSLHHQADVGRGDGHRVASGRPGLDLAVAPLTPGQTPTELQLAAGRTGGRGLAGLLEPQVPSLHLPAVRSQG